MTQQASAWDLGPDVPQRWGGDTLVRFSARREVEPRFSRALSPGGSHVSSSPALPDGGRERGASQAARRSEKPAGGPIEGKDRRARET